jgi:hypothetical protein
MKNKRNQIEPLSFIEAVMATVFLAIFTAVFLLIVASAIGTLPLP